MQNFIILPLCISPDCLAESYLVGNSNDRFSCAEALVISVAMIRTLGKRTVGSLRTRRGKACLQTFRLMDQITLKPTSGSISSLARQKLTSSHMLLTVKFSHILRHN